ncbi:hypothetical protein ACFYQA_19560 [Streptomyces sp. NPDC005774]|uniref:hypothetical protein n=1 Tax=Streptomyces sp. NPDC005774 TaxID=3364728 RepID=UPI0036CDE6FB
MSALFPVVSMVTALVFGVVGVLALVTGRVVLPWLSSSVRRPGIWGAGALLSAGAVATARIMPFEVNVPIMLGGFVLIGLAQVLGSRESRQAE